MLLLMLLLFDQCFCLQLLFNYVMLCYFAKNILFAQNVKDIFYNLAAHANYTPTTLIVTKFARSGLICAPLQDTDFTSILLIQYQTILSDKHLLYTRKFSCYVNFVVKPLIRNFAFKILRIT